MDRKQSKFIEEQNISDGDYLGFFGGSVNRKITWARFKTIILDFLAINFLIGSPSTLASAQLMNLPANASVRTKGCLAIGDGGQGDYLVLDSAPTAIDGYSVAEMANGRYLVLQPVNGVVVPEHFGGDLQIAIAFCKAIGIRLLLGDGDTVLVPSEALTLQDAFDCTLIYSGSKVTVNIESGHELTHGLRLESGDWVGYAITADDAITYLADGFVGVSVESTAASAVIAGKGAIMPTLACLIQADDKAEAGYQCYSGSTGHVSANCGITYSAKFGLYVTNNSKLHAPSSNFSYCGLVNRVTTNSQLEAEGINCSNTQDRGYPDPNSDRGALDVSRGSIVNIKSQGANVTNLSNSAGNGLSVRRSFVSAEGINASDCSLTALRVEACAQVAAGGSDLSGAGDYGVLAGYGAKVDVVGSDISGCTNYAISATRLAEVSAELANCQNTSGTGRAVYAADGGKIDANRVNASGANNVGFYALNGGEINCRGATCDMTGSAAGSYAVLADYGSKVNASTGTFSNSTSGQDFRCLRGSTITANGATGTPSKTVNTLDVNGVIYQ